MYNVMFWNHTHALLIGYQSQFMFDSRKEAFDFIRATLKHFIKQGLTDISIDNVETAREWFIYDFIQKKQAAG